MAHELLTLPIPADLLKTIDTIAEASSRSRNDVVILAVREYLRAEGDHLPEALVGKNQIAAGEFEMLDDVIADVEGILSGKVA